jgi:type IV pilus assembly protein PilE
MSVTRILPTKPSSGFTLIEVMIVVVIVGVLALVAYPAYQSSMIKSNRAAAKSYLMDVAQKEQLFFNDTRTYAADLATLKSSAPDRVSDNYVVDDSFITVTDGPPPTFIVSATPKAGTIQANDGVLTIDNTGAKLHGTESW